MLAHFPEYCSHNSREDIASGRRTTQQPGLVSVNADPAAPFPPIVKLPSTKPLPLPLPLEDEEKPEGQEEESGYRHTPLLSRLGTGAWHRAACASVWQAEEYPKKAYRNKALTGANRR
jgi:hypothetical protein